MKKITYFKRLSDETEFKFIQVKIDGLEGISKDGEIVTLALKDRTTCYSR